MESKSSMELNASRTRSVKPSIGALPASNNVSALASPRAVTSVSLNIAFKLLLFPVNSTTLSLVNLLFSSIKLWTSSVSSPYSLD